MNKKVQALVVLFAVSFSLSATFVSIASAVEDSWVTLEPMPTARSGLGVAVVDGKIYAIGGYDGDTRLAVNEKYTPVDYIPEFPSWAILPLLIVATLVAILYKKRLPKNISNQQKSFILGD